MEYCCCSVARSCPTVCDPVDYRQPGFSMQGIPQARILEWVAIFLPRGPACPGVKPAFPAWQADSSPLSHLGMEWSIPVEYYWNGILLSKKKKRERENISPFTATWMNLESIMLCEMSDRKTNTIWSHLYIESKKQTENIQIQRIFGCQKGGHLWGCKIGEED